MLRRFQATGAGLPPEFVAWRGAPHVDEDLRRDVAAILGAVRERGDDALVECTARYDGVTLQPGQLRVAPEAIGEAAAQVAPEVRDALELAATRIRTYHRRQVAARNPTSLVGDGLEVLERHVAVGSAGIYVPGGRAAYPSSVLMCAVPARVAGVGRVALCIPPGPDGLPPAVTLAAAAVAGVDEVYALGGAQAIGALAYGTATVAPVDVIAGPGNRWVTEAKRQVAAAGVVGIDGPAGPSELVVIADGDAEPALVAADLVAQAEHGPGGRIVALTWDPAFADRLDDAVGAAVAAASRAAEIRRTLGEVGAIVVCDRPDTAVTLAEALAPEHLALVGREAEPLAERIERAGAVFVGAQAAVALGDYVAGPSHVLPTGGAARFASALGVDAFRRHLHVVRVTGDTAALRSAAVVLARAEGLDAHAASLEVRRP